MDSIVQQMISFEKNEVIHLNPQQKFTTTLGFLNEVNIQKQQDILKVFFKSIENELPIRKNYFVVRQSISNNTFVNIHNNLEEQEQEQSNGMTLIVSNSPEKFLSCFDENYEFIEYFLDVPKKKFIFRHQFNVVSTEVFMKKRKNFEEEYWSRVIFDSVQNIYNLFVKLTLKNDFLWIIDHCLHHDVLINYYSFCHYYNVDIHNNNSKRWIKNFVESDLLRSIVINTPSFFIPLDTTKIHKFQINCNYTKFCTNLHYNNNDMYSLVSLTNSKYSPELDLTSKRCQVCGFNCTFMYEECGHTFCKSCIKKILAESNINIVTKGCKMCSKFSTLLYNEFLEKLDITQLRLRPRHVYIDKYILENNCTNENTLLFSRNDNNVHKMYEQFTFQNIENMNDLQNNFFEIDQNIKHIIFCDILYFLHDMIHFIQINFPHIENYVCFEHI